MATTTKQQQTKPPADPVAAAEQAIAALERDRASLVAARVQDDAEMQKNAYAARVLHEMGATRALSEIAERAREHDQRLREIDAAMATAEKVLEQARAAESKAQAREVAAELLNRAARLLQHGQSLDDANTVRVEASRAIAEELTQMRSLAQGIGVHVPSHEQYLALGSRAEQTATMQTPFAREVGEHLAPRDRRTHASYAVPWVEAITEAARAIMGEGKSREAA